MIQIKVGIQLSCLQQPFKKALLIAARLGADAVEIDARNELRPADMSRTAVRHVRKLLEDVNLRICSVAFQTRRGYEVAEDLDARIEATKRAMQMAYDLGASVVVNQVGRVPESDGPEWSRLTESLADIGRHGQRVGATLAAKTGTEDASDLQRLIEALPDGSIGVDLDPGNLIINGFSASQAAETIGQHIVHVHAHDGVRDLAQGRGIEVPLGRGSADFPELMGLLEQHDYRGYFTVARQNVDDPAGEIGRAVEFLRNVG